MQVHFMREEIMTPPRSVEEWARYISDGVELCDDECKFYADALLAYAAGQVAQVRGEERERVQVLEEALGRIRKMAESGSDAVAVETVARTALRKDGVPPLHCSRCPYTGGCITMPGQWCEHKLLRAALCARATHQL